MDTTELNTAQSTNDEDIGVLVDFIKNTNNITEASAIAIAKNFIPKTFIKNEFIKLRN